MDALPYVDTLFKEYLLFRGFTTTLEAFNKDLANDPGCGFQAERITELIFRKFIPGLDCQQLVDFLEFLNIGLYSRLDSRYEPLVSAVEADLLRLFLVTAHNAKRPDKVAEFFKLYGPQLLSNSRSRSGVGIEDVSDWKDWFVLPYLQYPEREQRFQVYFSPEWASLLETSFRNFLAGVMRCLPLPAVLRFNTDRRLRLALQQQVQVLQAELEQSRKQLAAVTAQLQDTQQVQQQEAEAASMQGVSLLQQQQQQQQLEDEHQDQQATISTDQFPTTADVNKVRAVGVVPQSSHRRDLSLGDWPQQQQRRYSVPGGATEQLQQQVVQSQHTGSGKREGSGLFELLPSPQQSLTASVAAVVAAAAVGQQQQPYVGSERVAGGGQQQHSRTASVGGGISFQVAQYDQQQDDNATAAAVAGSIVSEDSQQQQQHQHQQQQQAAVPETSDRFAVVSRPASTTADSTDVSTASSRRASSTAAAVPLSSSPVMSWASGMALASSAAGLRSQHTSSTVSGNASSTSDWRDASATEDSQPSAATTPVVLLPGPLRCPVHVIEQLDPAGSNTACLTCVAFSPSGRNIATAYDDGTVSIWSPRGVPETYPHRCASFACGVPISSIAWDLRADKLMLVGCSSGGGVRAWHADTKRVVCDVGFEAGYPHVVGVAACPAEMSFIVAANSKPLLDPHVPAVMEERQTCVGSSSSTQVHGRLVLYNSRSFKRSAILAVPGDVGLVSVAYSSSGGQLAVGTAAGTTLLYEPSGRSSPLRVLQVAAACGVSSSRTSSMQPVQVCWRQSPAAAPLAARSSSSSNIGTHSGVAGGTGSLLTLCNGVLCEWAVNSDNSRTPVAAVDIVAAAAAALPARHSMQQQGDEAIAVNAPVLDKSDLPRLSWSWCLAVSGDGNRCAVLCATESAGAVLLYEFGGGSLTGQAPQVLLAGRLLAGGGDLSWHPSNSLLIVGVARNSSRLMVLDIG